MSCGCVLWCQQGEGHSGWESVRDYKEVGTDRGPRTEPGQGGETEVAGRGAGWKSLGGAKKVSGRRKHYLAREFLKVFLFFTSLPSC